MSTSRKRSVRSSVLLTVLIVALCIAAGMANTKLIRSDDGRPFSPHSLDAQGATALAQLLNQAGISVTHAQTHAELVRTTADTTVLLTDATALTADDVNFLKDSGATVIILGTATIDDLSSWGFNDNAWTSQMFFPGDDLSDATVTASACDATLPLIEDDANGSTLSPVSQVMIGANSPTSCFTTSDGAAVVQSPQYPTVWYFGATDALTNAYLSTADNAGVALRLLGQHPSVMWVEGYTPVHATIAENSNLPRWLTLAFIALAFSGLWLGLYKGRRFGKLVAEPMPVVVPAAEANQGRARMYRAGGDAAHAARALRAGFISRYASRLGITASAQPPAVIAAFSTKLTRTGSASAAETERAVAGALYTTPVRTDGDLATLAAALGKLEKELTDETSR